MLRNWKILAAGLAVLAAIVAAVLLLPPPRPALGQSTVGTVFSDVPLEKGDKLFALEFAGGDYNRCSGWQETWTVTRNRGDYTELFYVGITNEEVHAGAMLLVGEPVEGDCSAAEVMAHAISSSN